MSTPPGKEQVKMYLPSDLVADLERLAESHGRRSKQVIIEELIQFYLPVWKNVDANLKQAVARQLDQTGLNVTLAADSGSAEPKETTATFNGEIGGGLPQRTVNTDEDGSSTRDNSNVSQPRKRGGRS